MHKVYQNSYCTLAASLATNPTEGLFWARRPGLGKAFQIQSQFSNFQKQFKVTHNMYSTILEHSLLYKRGWVLQESYLSPRTIHFSRYPAFQCLEQFSSADYEKPNQGLSLLQWKAWPTSKKVLLEPTSFSWQYWCRIIQEYSFCRLTVPTDKLIALSGIAKVVSSMAYRGSHGYYAGIWEMAWLWGLLWTPVKWVPGQDKGPVRPKSAYIVKTSSSNRTIHADSSAQYSTIMALGIG